MAEGPLRFGWLSDIHLDFLDHEEREAFFHRLKERSLEAWLLSGDISQARSLATCLADFVRIVERPLYFVLGNHDYYHGSIAGVRREIRDLCQTLPLLVYLNEAEPLLFGEKTAIVGVDGWGDARLGNPMTSPVFLNDFRLIEDLQELSRRERVQVLRRLGSEAGARLKEQLEACPASVDELLVVLHVPPFKGASWHEGAISNADWLPWFSCQAAGDVLLAFAAERPACRLTVLCGHTHSSGVYSPRPNLVVFTAAAEYGCPRPQAVLQAVPERGFLPVLDGPPKS